MNFFTELKRRNVIRVGIAYAIATWVLLQVADLVLENIGAPAWVMQTIMLVLAIAFPIVLIFAWAFERTPEGIKREKDVDRSQSITHQTGRKLDRMIIGVLTVVVAYLLVDKVVLRDAPVTPPATGQQPAPEATDETKAAEAPNASVAVLPFVNMSGDRENEYFSDGLTETLLHMLAQLPDLRVAARTSSFAFKGQNKSVGEIAATLGVAHILEGSVQKAGDRVRVTAQLVRADDGFHVWSQNYTRPLEDIFAIQDEIAEDVASALGSSLLGGTTTELAGVHTRDLSAYDSYLKGLEQQAIFSYGSLEVAENHFEEALANDPGFTDARLSLVRNYLLKNGTGLITTDETRRAVEPLIAKAREEEPDSALARALELTFTLQMFDVTKTSEEIAAITDELRDLLLQLPTETYIRARAAGTLHDYFGRSREAIEVLQAGLMIDPLANDLHIELGSVYADIGRPDDARTALTRSLEIAPENPNTYGALSDVEKELDNLAAGLDWMRQATEVDPQDHELASHIARDLFELELPEEGERWYGRVQSLAPGSAIARSLEVQRALARNDKDRAIELARAAIADQIGLRQSSFPNVVFAYATLMLEADRGEEAYEFFASVRPEITNYGQLTGDLHGMIMQWVSFALLSGFETFENRQAAWQAFTGQLDAMGFPWLQEPDDLNHTWNYLISGELDQAIDHYLEYRLNRPLAKNLKRHKRPLRQFYGPLYEDPRVAAKLNEEAQRYAQVREEVREMLLRPEWSQ